MRLRIKHQGDYGKHHHAESIRPESTGEITVEQRMEHPLAATPHTLQSCETMEDALRHPTALQGIEKIINHCHNRSGQDKRNHEPSPWFLIFIYHKSLYLSEL